MDEAQRRAEIAKRVDHSTAKSIDTRQPVSAGIEVPASSQRDKPENPAKSFFMNVGQFLPLRS